MKNWLRGKKKSKRAQDSEESRAPTVDELLSLGKPEEAHQVLEHKLRSKPRDRRTQAKLGDVLLVLRRHSEALEMYESAAQGYASDGFHDKSRAILHKMLKIAPNHEKAVLGLEQLERAKERDRRRRIVMRHLQKSGEGSHGSMAAFQVNQLWKALSRSSVLETLDTASLGRLFEHLEMRLYDVGREIVRRGDTLEEMYILASGQVEVIEKRAAGKPVVLRSYDPGDVFGEGALLEHRAWQASHRAAKKARILCLDGDGLAAVLPGLSDPRAFLDVLRTQRHDASLAAMIRTVEED